MAVRSKEKKLEILEYEKQYWEDRMYVYPDMRHIYHAGYCEVIDMIENIDDVSVIKLREKYKRTDKEVIEKAGNYELYKTRVERKKCRLEAIGNVGKALVDKKDG